MRQAAGLRRDLERLDQAVECTAGSPPTTSTDSAGRIDADHGIAAAILQPVDRREEYAEKVVGGMVGLNANAQHPALAHRVAAARNDAHLARGQYQVFVAHQLRNRRRDLRDQARVDRE